LEAYDEAFAKENPSACDLLDMALGCFTVRRECVESYMYRRMGYGGLKTPQAGL
jgi:hypothetical protein